MGGLPPVLQAQAFLETFFLSISQGAHDKAKEQSDKERENAKSCAGTPWAALVLMLGQFAVSEKSYLSLIFLAPKWFGRKDSLKGTYSSFVGECRRMQEHADERVASGNKASVELDQLIAHLCGQLHQFTVARVKMMDFYEQVAMMGSSRHVKYQDLHTVVTDISQEYQRCFHHPILGPLKQSFSMECDINANLLAAQLATCDWQFLPALLQLSDAHSKLTQCHVTTSAAAAPSRKLAFTMQKQPQMSHLFQWLNKYKALLVSKFTLYFYETLSKQVPSGEMKPQLGKLPIDFISRIASFQKKSDACCVCLVYDGTGQDVTHRGGYHHTLRPSEVPTGLDSYPAIYSFPPERPDRHWPNIVSIMGTKMFQKNPFDKPYYFCDEKIQSTYFLSRIESRITLVVIFESKKSEKDSYINNFIMENSTQLRCTKHYAALKPGVKS